MRCETNAQLDVEAIRSRLYAATARDVGSVDADIDAEVDRAQRAQTTLHAFAATDIRLLLDENERLLKIFDELTRDNASCTAAVEC